MPGNDQRRPADVDRAPASRVGDELQERTQGMDATDVSDAEGERIEDDAVAAAERKGWDQSQTERERSTPG
jgi:hypothetical protein